MAWTELRCTVEVCNGSKHLMFVSLYKEMEHLSSFPNLSRARLLPANPYLCVDFHWHHCTVKVIVHANTFICRLQARVYVCWTVWFALFIWESFQFWIVSFAAQPPEMFPSHFSLQLTAEFLSWKMPERTRLSESHTLWSKTLTLSYAHWNLIIYIKEDKYVNINN